MQLIDKCSKKKKIVKYNLIKFMYLVILQNNTVYVLKMIRTLNLIKDIFKREENLDSFFSHVLFEPKINFGFNNIKKRKSLKKKLRKKKKFESE